MRLFLAAMIASTTLMSLFPAAVSGEPSEAPVFLFTSFRGNGEDGLHLAASDDGYAWRPLRDDRSFLAPQVGSKLMRDPSLRLGPDGRFHMVWTTGWMDDGFGYASSADLLSWSEQRYVPINREVKGAKNTWAPELYFDDASAKWYILFSTTVEGLFPDQPLDDGGLNHRAYFTTTVDFKDFSPPRVFHDPGFNTIDGVLFRHHNLYRFLFKDERLGQKRLRLATSAQVEGPYGPCTEPFTRDWVEGPSAIRIGEEWFVYFDHYADPQFYGAVKSRDLKAWEDVSDKMKFPKDFRHGTVIAVDRGVVEALERAPLEP